MRLPTIGRELALVMATAALASTTLSLGIPLLTLVMERHDVGALWIGVNGAAGGMGIFLLAPFIGRAMRRLGAIGLIQTSLVAAGLIVLLFPIAFDLRLWFLWRLVLGCAGATMFVVSEAAVNALAAPSERGRIVAVYATLFSAGYAVGPIILAITGSEGWTPFLACSAILLASALPLALSPPIDHAFAGETGATGEHGETGMHGETGVADEAGEHRNAPLLTCVRKAPLPYAGVLVYSVIETSFFTLLPLFALAYGLQERAAALVLSVWIAGNIALQYPLGTLVDRHGARRVMAATSAGCILLLLALPTVMGTPLLYTPVFFVMGGLMGGLYTISLTLLGAHFPPAQITRANTAFVMTFQLGTLTGPALAGAAMFATTATALPLTLCAALAALTAITLRRGRNDGR